MLRLPGILLHEHLDGGLRPQTVAELAGDVGHRLPVAPARLEEWFDQGRSGSLERYLAAFEHTVGVMQTRPALERVAEEAIEDLAADGVAYAEIRFAPKLCTLRGLTGDDVLDAVLRGLERAGRRHGVMWGVIVDAMRNDPDSLQEAVMAVRWAERGVVGFDLAGPEFGYPPEAHLEAIEAAREGGLRITVHAGEAAGVASIRSAAGVCGAERLGHGVEIIDDCRVEGGDIVDLGEVAQDVHSRRIPLEICPTSNLHTKGWPAEEHPVGMLHRAGFAVTINTDNRLMSRTSLSLEFEFLRTHHGFTATDEDVVTRTAVDAAFCDADTRARLLDLLPPVRPSGLDT